MIQERIPYNNAQGYNPKYFLFSGICDEKNLLADTTDQTKHKGTTTILIKTKGMTAVIKDEQARGNRQ